MPKNAECWHRRCAGGPCRAFTDEELTPTDEDMEFARKVIADGYHQVSSKYRWLAKPPRMPLFSDIIRPEHQDTHEGRALARMYQDYVRSRIRIDSETIEVTFRQFRAFKLLGGPVA